MADTTQSLPNLLIIGTSNSIQRHGYRVALEGCFAEIQNLAVGASTSIMHGLRRRELTVRDGFAIFDHCVNEARLSRARLLSTEIQDSSLESFLGLCGERNLKPIILIMPSHWQYAPDGPVRARYIDWAQTHGIPWFDGFALTERLYRVRPELARYGFGPGAHSEPEVAQAIGHALVAAIQLTSSWSLGDRPSARLDASHVDGADLVDRRSGLDSRRFLQLREGESVTLPVEGEVIGVAFNAGMTNAVIEIATGEMRYRKQLRSSLYRYREFCQVIWPLTRPIPGDGPVTVRCLRGDAAVDEANDHMAKNDDGLLDPPMLELGALVTRTRGVARHPSSSGRLDMAAGLTDDDIAACAAKAVTTLASQ